MIMIDIEMPERCGSCPCFHAEHPIYCQLIKPPDKNKQLAAPYGLPRPEWCPLKEQKAKPMTEYDDGWDCPRCGLKLVGKTASGYPCDEFDLPDDEIVKYCPVCGQEVKWDG